LQEDVDLFIVPYSLIILHVNCLFRIFNMNTIFFLVKCSKLMVQVREVSCFSWRWRGREKS